MAAPINKEIPKLPSPRYVENHREPKASIVVNDVNNILNYRVKPNFALLSSKYGSNMKNIITFLNKEDQNKLVLEIEKNRKINIATGADEFEILEEELIIEEIPKNNLCINGNKEFKVGLDIHISEKLKMEGTVRDLIRHVQNLRKESNLEVSDRISFSIKCSSEVSNAINQFKDYFQNETLVESMTNDLDSMDYSSKFKIDGVDIKISISKIS